MDDYEERIEKLTKSIPEYAKAKAERVYIEQFRKSKKAILMREALKLKTQSEKEQYAYAHPDYIELLKGLKEAVEIEESV